MKKKYKIIAMLYFIIITIIVLMGDSSKLVMDLEYIKCGTANGIPKPIPQLTSIAYTLLTVGTPLILIVFGIVALIKAILSGNEDGIMTAKNKLIKKFVISAIIFFVASIVQFVVTRVSSNDNDRSSITSCLKCFLYLNNCQVSDTGNNVNKESKLATYSNRAQKTGSNHAERSNGNKSNSQSSSSTSSKGDKTIFVGDSRTVGMCNLNTSSLYSGKCRDYLAVCQIGKGYSWFNSTAGSTVTEMLKKDSNKKYNIVILLGVNDIETTVSAADRMANNYMSAIKKYANGDWKKHNIIFTSITPINGNSAGGVSKTSINRFNSQMKSKINAANLSNVKYCDISNINLNGKFEPDGLHYTASGSTTLYNQVKNKCL